MGQYHIPVNVTKRQFINPHAFGDGFKLVEFGASGTGTMFGLAILLADSNGRGGGDLPNRSVPEEIHKVVGSWAGDRIVITGDYGDKGKLYSASEYPDCRRVLDENGAPVPWGNVSLWDLAFHSFEDVSAKVLAALIQSDYYRETFVAKAVRSFQSRIQTPDGRDVVEDSPFRRCFRAALALLGEPDLTPPILSWEARTCQDLAEATRIVEHLTRCLESIRARAGG